MSLANVVAVVLNILNDFVWLLGLVAIVIFLYGIVKYVFQASSGKKQPHNTILWSMLAMFILFSLWGILRLACNSLANGELCSPPGTPTDIRYVPASGGSVNSSPLVF